MQDTFVRLHFRANSINGTRVASDEGQEPGSMDNAPGNTGDAVQIGQGPPQLLGWLE